MSKYEGHTPGPWEVGAYNDAADNLGWLYRINLGQSAFDYEAKANACLIADAPTLLAQRDALAAALRELVAEADEHPGWEGHRYSNSLGFEMARAALAKMEEES